jgi:hypothetical protein|tara:strand:+ start:2981 stop:3142 length:162 start_codon:yes stop_codon:yes gene_type:complete
MNENKELLNSEIIKLFNEIIYKQNIELIKKIAKDYKRDEQKLIENYKNGIYKI